MQPRNYYHGYTAKGYLLFDDKGTDIGIACRHGHGAENTVALAPCDNADIISCILLEVASSAFIDHCACCGCILGSGLVPVPFSVGIRRNENIVSVAAVDDVPADIHLQIVP